MWRLMRQRGGRKPETQKRESKNMNIKFYRQDPRIALAHLYVSTISTMINHRSVTKT